MAPLTSRSIPPRETAAVGRFSQTPIDGYTGVPALVGRFVRLNSPGNSPHTIQWRVVSVQDAKQLVTLESVRSKHRHKLTVNELDGYMVRGELILGSDEGGA